MPDIVIRRRPAFAPGGIADQWAVLPMWHDEVLVDGGRLCRSFWSPDGHLLVDAVEPPRALLDQGWKLVGWSGSVPVLARPRCTNAEPGTFNHECGKPAAWIGTTEAGHASAFCDRCKASGWERHGRTFRRIGETA